MSDNGTIRIEDFKGLRVAYLRDQGHSVNVSPPLMHKLRALAEKAGSDGPHALHVPDALFLSIINDNPHATERGHVRVDSAVSVAARFQLAKGSELEMRDLSPGPHAVYRHVGSYKGLRDAWARMSSLKMEGFRLRGPCTLGPRVPGDPGPEMAPSFEIYLKDPAHTPEADLITDLYQPVEEYKAP